MTDSVRRPARTGPAEYRLPTAGAARNGPAVNLTVAAMLALWLGLVSLLGARGVFHTPTGALLLPLLLGVTVPMLLFLGLYWTVDSFRRFVLAADLRLATGVQAWRFAGFAFLALYAYRVLPGLFAWPAGLGDMAIGVTAPWIVMALVQRPAFAASRGFVIWQLLGLLDLVVAIGMGVLSSGTARGLGGMVTTNPMGTLPLVLVPCYFVPLFAMLHLTALFQARQWARSARL